jgi:hypothetical protein
MKTLLALVKLRPTPPARSRMLRVQERKMNIAGSLGLKIGGDDGDADKGKERLYHPRAEAGYSKCKQKQPTIKP